MIDIDRIRKDLREENFGAFFGGGFGGAMVEAFDIDGLSPEELIKLARQRGLDISEYLSEDD